MSGHEGRSTAAILFELATRMLLFFGFPIAALTEHWAAAMLLGVGLICAVVEDNGINSRRTKP